MPNSPLLSNHKANGAHLTEEAGWHFPADFGDPIAEHTSCRESAIVIDLSQRGKIRISGSDAARFLHGMLSNHVDDLKTGEGIYTTFLTRQGKFITDLYLYRHEDSFIANFASDMEATFAESIEKYIIMDDVEVEDLTESQCMFGLFGPESRNILAGFGLTVPSLPEHGHLTSNNIMIARELWTGEDGYLLTAPNSRAELIWNALGESGARPAGQTAFESLTLEAGIPLFGKDMDENINPMQAGIESRAIDFKKGCFVGQEVIAKIKYLGQVNRGLAGIRLEGDISPKAGDKVDFGGIEAGLITRSAFGATVGKVICFGLLHRKAMSPGTSILVRSNGIDIAGVVVDLPFYRNVTLFAEPAQES